MKRIGNKYKQQTVEAEKRRDEAEKQKEDALTKLKDGQGKVSENELKQVQEKLTKSEADLATITEKFGASESGKIQAMKEKKEVETKLTETSQKLTSADEVLPCFMFQLHQMCSVILRTFKV